MYYLSLVLLVLAVCFFFFLFCFVLFFFFNDTATTEIYTLSLHDALPISFHDRSWTLTAPVGASFRMIVGTLLEHVNT